MKTGRHNCIRILAYNIRERRKILGETQEYVAEKAGISYRAYQSLESGRGNPSIKTLEALASFYKLTVSRLFELTMVRTQHLHFFALQIKKNFADAKSAVYMWDMEGTILWGNHAYREITGITDVFPFDMMRRLSPPLKEIFRCHLDAQKRGLVHPLVKIIEAKDGDRQMIRTYGIIVCEKNYSYPTINIGHASPSSSDSEAFHYDFCEKILDLIADPKP